MPLCRAGDEDADDTGVEDDATSSVAEAAAGARGAVTGTGTAAVGAEVSEDEVEAAAWVASSSRSASGKKTVEVEVAERGREGSAGEERGESCATVCGD